MRNGSKNILFTIAVFLLTLGLVSTALAAPTAELWPRWQANDVHSKIQVDHSAWAQFLSTYLVGSTAEGPNLVRYGAVTSADEQSLADYLTKLSTLPVATLNPAEQKAYWINLYNALTVKTILDHYPLESIRDIKSGWFSAGPWDLKLIKVDGIELSLNDIEHRILRPIWRDNRIHYAVNCASYSCPNLQPEPFTAANSDRLLDQAAHDYVNSPRGIKFDGDTLTLSSIYDWYQIDFGGDETSLLSYIETLAAPELKARLKDFNGNVTFAYDWRLNGK